LLDHFSQAKPNHYDSDRRGKERGHCRKRLGTAPPTRQVLQRGE
jgi:hypothetical protein